MSFNVPEEDRLWLKQQAIAHRLSVAEVVRRAVKHYRQCGQHTTDTSIEKHLLQTKGVWLNGDGLTYQHNIRDEW